MTVADVLREAVRALSDAGIPDAPRDARKLMARALDVPSDRVSLHLGDKIDAADEQLFADLVADRLVLRKPVSRILGRRSFFRHEFAVSDDTLDPRPETEILVEAALAGPIHRVLDLGTGTGAILLSILAERPAAQGLGTDLSEGALRTARHNADRLGLKGRAEFALSDWFDAVSGQFDLIVSNPPYIAADEMPGLAPEVRDHDPEMALTDGADGLTAYRKIAAGATSYLLPGGRLMVEIGATQAPAVTALFRDAGLDVVAVYADFDGRSRVISAQKADFT